VWMGTITDSAAGPLLTPMGHGASIPSVVPQ